MILAVFPWIQIFSIPLSFPFAHLTCLAMVRHPCAQQSSARLVTHCGTVTSQR